MKKTEETTKSNNATESTVNLSNLTEDQALSILDEVTNTGLDKMQGTYAVFAINKLKAVLTEVKSLREKVTTMAECNANHPCFDPATGKCDCED